MGFSPGFVLAGFWAQTTGWQEPRQSLQIDRPDMDAVRAARAMPRPGILASRAPVLCCRRLVTASADGRSEPHRLAPDAGNSTWKFNKKRLVVAQHSRTERQDPGAAVAGRAGIFIKLRDILQGLFWQVNAGSH
jgi:hypothetical protein